MAIRIMQSTLLNNDAIKKKKTSLKRVEHTVVTRRDGSRYRVNNGNGTTTELPKVQTELNKDEAAYASALEAEEAYRSQQAEERAVQSKKGIEELTKCIIDSQIEIFAFDFDMTLVNIHAYVQRVQVEDVEHRYMHDIPNVQELKLVLDTIVSLGKSWCIVTFGQLDVVTAYMLAIGFDLSQVQVLSPLKNGQQRYTAKRLPPTDKNHFLKQLATKSGKQHGELILFDDDQDNVTAALSNGFLAVAVVPKRGICVDNFIDYVYIAVESRQYETADI